MQIRWGEGSKWSLTILLSTNGLFVTAWLGTAYLVPLVLVFHALEQLGLIVGLWCVNSCYVLGSFGSDTQCLCSGKWVLSQVFLSGDAGGSSRT